MKSFEVTIFDEEEMLAVMEVLNKMRDEKAKQKKIETAKKELETHVWTIANAIGLAETKKIIREINRDLREAG